MSPDPIIDARRVGALRDTGALERSAGTTLDALARRAAERVGAPVALVSLVDADRQVFAGHTGLPGEWASAAETPLSHSFCQHVVRGDEPLVVEDSHAHPLVRDNLAVRDLDVRAYAGVPLRVRDGAPVGALCVLDSSPRRWTAGELAALAELAAPVEQALRAGLPDHDGLTGLLTADQLTEHVAAALDRSAGGEIVVVLSVGVDDIDAINEALGVRAGDELLRAVAARVTGALDGATVGRTTGDVFVALLEAADRGDVMTVAARLSAAVAAEPFPIGGEEHRPSVRVGIAVADRTGAAGDLLARAVRSLDHLRALGCQSRSAARERLVGRAIGADRIRAALPGALERGELTLRLTPAAAGPPALAADMRWESPELGPVAAAAWLPVAEQTGAIVPIGEWVVAEACAQLAALGAGGDARLVVEVSATQLGPASFAGVVERACAGAGLPTGRLALRVRPGPHPLDRGGRAETLARLRGLGVDVRAAAAGIPAP